MIRFSPAIFGAITKLYRKSKILRCCIASKHIVVKDIATPATYARYSGSPSGSLYDMASLVTQFGPKRLPMITPVKNLYQPKFSHGLYGTMMNGVQVVDLLVDRKFNGGNSLFAPINR